MAGLIPQSFIDDLLARADIVEVVDKRVALKKAGQNYTACCPFHNEKTPSFSVNQDKQFYYCFGCGAGGNAIGFVMNYESLDFPAAVEALAKDMGLDVPREQSKAEARKKSENEKLIEVLDHSARYYQLQLRQHAGRQQVVDYLKSRGLSGEIARDFGLGFAPPGWDNLLNEAGKTPDTQQALFRAGMVIKREEKTVARGASTGQAGDTAAGSQPADAGDNRASNDPGYYDRFRNRVMFPIRDTRGRTIAFGGRVLGDDKPKYLNSPETPVFHKGSELYGLYEAKKSRQKLERILIVEGYMDVIALAQMGIHNAVATLGTATSAKHLTRLFRMVSEVVFCFDGDQAGRTAAWRALETVIPLMEDGRSVRFLFLPEGSDPDTFVREAGAEGFLQAVQQADPLEEFFFQKLGANLDLGSIEGRARLSNLAGPLIRKFPGGIYGTLIRDRLAKTLGVETSALNQLLAQNSRQAGASQQHAGQSGTGPGMAAGTPPADRPAPPPFPARGPGKAGAAATRKPNSLKAIELLLRNPEVALAIEADLGPLQQAEDEARKLLLTLIEIVRDDPKTETFTLMGYCYGSSLGGQLTQLLKAERITPVEGIEQEFLQIIDNILSDIQRKLDALQLKSRLDSQFGTSTAVSAPPEGAETGPAADAEQ